MEILKTWLQIAGLLALCLVTLAWYQTRQTLGIREAELARFKAQPHDEAAAAAAAAAVEVRDAPLASTPGPAAQPGGSGDETQQDLLKITAERDRYREGLESCVNEANRLASQSGKQFEFVLPPSSSGGSTPVSVSAAKIVPLEPQPSLLPMGDHFQVFGKVYNVGTAPGGVAVVITLQKPGRRLQARESVTGIPPGGVASYSHNFVQNDFEGGWAASIALEPL